MFNVRFVRFVCSVAPQTHSPSTIIAQSHLITTSIEAKTFLITKIYVFITKLFTLLWFKGIYESISFNNIFSSSGSSFVRSLSFIHSFGIFAWCLPLDFIAMLPRNFFLSFFFSFVDLLTKHIWEWPRRVVNCWIIFVVLFQMPGGFVYSLYAPQASQPANQIHLWCCWYDPCVRSVCAQVCVLCVMFEYLIRARNFVVAFGRLGRQWAWRFPAFKIH